MLFSHRHIALGLLLIAVLACRREAPLFRLLPPERTGIDFANPIAVNDTFNAILFEYIYHGGGVAAADFNDDGLVDLFFTGNQTSSRLYLNRGDLRFEDVTQRAGLLTGRWCTGAAVADVNGDGRPDIYVAVAGFGVPADSMANLLFIHQGNDAEGVPRFSEHGQAYGVADTAFSIHAAFFDYDGDGDLDLYVLNNAMEKFDRNRLRPKRVAGEADSNDRLFRNENGRRFTDVTLETGITIEGYGLGVLVADVNQDGRPDVYVANDFLSNDLLWINNGPDAQGRVTFSDKAPEYFKHQTHNSMGVDIGDLNNDGRPEILVLDMLPEDNYREKIMLPRDNYDKYRMRLMMGYEPQFVRNTLQWHRGFTSEGEPRFSEIAFLAGLAATDWSWAALMADFDNDGWMDIFIANGFRKDITNLDFVSYSDLRFMFGTEESKQQRAYEELEQLPEVKIRNYLYRNKGDLTFEDKTSAWGLAQPSFSNGVAYVDLDNDGDLDLVISNLDGPAFVYENRLNNKGGKSPNYLRARLHSPAAGPRADNAKVILYQGGRRQYRDHTRYRGYMSTVEDALHFGLGDAAGVDSLIIVWPDGHLQRLFDVAANQTLDIRYAPESGDWRTHVRPAPPRPLFAPFEGGKAGLDYLHAGNDFVDFMTTRTLPHMHSKGGPGIAVGDIDGDGREDFFIGGDLDQPGGFFFQEAGGNFRQVSLGIDSLFLDMGCLLFDADGDGDLDLYVVSGGSHLPAGSEAYQDRLYLNDGAGAFARAWEALPSMMSSGACVIAADFDGDGDLDLFVGGRISPGSYPLAPRSYLLRNDTEPGGRARFTDVTEALAPGLGDIGMVGAALWTDFDGDGRFDLIVAGEWMPISFFRNEGGRLKKVDVPIEQTPKKDNRKTNDLSAGWWNSIAAADLDGDGDIDYVLGNLGRNAKLRTSQAQPVRVFAADFDGNGAVDPLIALYTQGKPYLLHARDILIDQIPAMKRRFSNYTAYAEAGLAQSLTRGEQQKALVLTAHTFASVVLENRGEAGFVMHELPLEAQIAPLNGLLLTDVNGDGLPDILGVGNFYHTETTLIGRHDASYGMVLLNQGEMRFRGANPLSAGFIVDGDARALTALELAGGRRLVIATQHRGQALAFTPTGRDNERRVALRASDAWAEIVLPGERRIRREFHYGQGYLSQSSRSFRLPANALEARIYSFQGYMRRIDPEGKLMTSQ
jgi:hypothetical protein